MDERVLIERQAIRTPKAAAIAGILFAVLLSISLILVRAAVPSDSLEAGEWVVDDSSRRFVRIALNLLPFAGIAFLWFIGVVRDRLGEGEDRLFATVFLGSGLLFVAMLFVSGADASALLVDPGAESSAPNDTVWSYGRRFTHTLVTVYAMRMAGVFMMSTTTLALRLGFLPRWMVYAGFIGAAILLLTSGSIPLVELIFPVWVLTISVYMLIAALRKQSDDLDAPVPASTS